MLHTYRFHILKNQHSCFTTVFILKQTFQDSYYACLYVCTFYIFVLPNFRCNIFLISAIRHTLVMFLFFFFDNVIYIFFIIMTSLFSAIQGKRNVCCIVFYLNLYNFYLCCLHMYVPFLFVTKVEALVAAHFYATYQNLIIKLKLILLYIN